MRFYALGQKIRFYAIGSDAYSGTCLAPIANRGIMQLSFNNRQTTRLCPQIPPNHPSSASAGSRASSAARPPVCCKGAADAGLTVRGIEVDAVTGDLRVLVSQPGEPGKPVEQVKDLIK